MAGDASRKNGLLGGRPTKLTEEVVKAAEKYVEDCFTGLDEIIVKRGFDKDGETRWEQTAPRLPNIARLGLECRVDKSTLYEWEKPNGGSETQKDDENVAALRRRFSHCIRAVQQLQEAMIVEEGGSGRIHPRFAAFLASAKHDYAERRELSGKDGGPIQVQAVKGFNLVPESEEEGE